MLFLWQVTKQQVKEEIVRHIPVVKETIERMSNRSPKETNTSETLGWM